MFADVAKDREWLLVYSRKMVESRKLLMLGYGTRQQDESLHLTAIMVTY
jgi:hypothetical protein